MKIKANGIEMNYELTGQGKTLVLIHGFSDNLTMWYNQVPVFAEQYRVLTYDVRGFGKTAVGDADITMELFAADLHALLTGLGIATACVLGYSMGGRIGMQFALDHPEMVAGLVFANSGVGAERTPEVEERFAMMMNVLQSGDNAFISEVMATGSFSPGFKEKNPATFDKYRQIKMENDPAPYAAIMAAMIRGMLSLSDLERLHCPALIIAGEQDGFMDVSLAQAMKAHLREATLLLLPTGHAAALEAPEAFNGAVLDFMKKLPWK